MVKKSIRVFVLLFSVCFFLNGCAEKQYFEDSINLEEASSELENYKTKVLSMPSDDKSVREVVSTSIEEDTFDDEGEINQIDVVEEKAEKIEYKEEAIDETFVEEIKSEEIKQKEADYEQPKEKKVEVADAKEETSKGEVTVPEKSEAAEQKAEEPKKIESLIEETNPGNNIPRESETPVEKIKLTVLILNESGADIGMIAIYDAAKDENVNIESIGIDEMIILEMEWPEGEETFRIAAYDAHGAKIKEVGLDFSDITQYAAISFEGNGSLSNITCETE